MAWSARWIARLESEGATPEDRLADMRAVNPAVIPRTHRIEAAIAAAVAGDYGLFEDLVSALEAPFSKPKNEALMRPPLAEEAVTQTFCGT